jgi:hypothetical protein
VSGTPAGAARVTGDPWEEPPASAKPLTVPVIASEPNAVASSKRDFIIGLDALVELLVA